VDIALTASPDVGRGHLRLLLSPSSSARRSWA